MNTTLVIDEATSDAIFFDPGASVQETLTYSKEKGIKIIHLIATHCHLDHISSASEAINALNLDLQIQLYFKGNSRAQSPLVVPNQDITEESKPAGSINPRMDSVR